MSRGGQPSNQSGSPARNPQPGQPIPPPRKILIRLSLWTRDWTALQAAMDAFEPDFNEQTFIAAFTSSDPDELNKARAVERDFEVIANYIAELAHEVVRDAKLVRRGAKRDARRDYGVLQTAGVISASVCTTLQAIQKMRNEEQHLYPDVKAPLLYQAIVDLLAVAPKFLSGYTKFLQTLGYTLTP